MQPDVAAPLRRPLPPRRVLAALGLFLLALAGCTRERPPVVIGAPGSWGSPNNGTTRDGMEFALQKLNAAGGRRRHRLQLRFVDDSTRLDLATSGIEALVTDPGVAVVIGPTQSHMAVAAAHLYHRGEVPAILPTTVSPDLVAASPWVYQLSADPAQYGPALARFAASRGWDRAAILWNNSSRGHAAALDFRRSFAGRIVADDPVGPLATPATSPGMVAQLEPFVTAYRQTVPDVVFVSGTAGYARDIMLLARQRDVPLTIVGMELLVPLMADSSLSAPVYVATPFDPTATDPATRTLVAEFTRAYGRPPDVGAALGYDAVMLAAQAIEAVGPHRARIRRYLSSLDHRAPFRGMTGAIRFDSRGIVVGRQLSIMQVLPGRLARVAR